MPSPARKPPLWERLRSARVVQVLLVYLGASWAILQITETLQGLLTLPEWVGPVSVVLLLIGLVVVLATAWVQSLPQTTAREEAGEIPTDWEVDPADVMASLRKGRLPHLTWGRAILGGVVALSLLFGGAGLYVIMKGPIGIVGPQEAGAESAAQGIAVLPFHVTGEGLQVYQEGMVDLMSANLDGLSEFRAIDARTVLARWNRDIGETADAELDAALRVAAGTGARYAVVGSGVEAGGQIRFTAEIYDLSDGSQVGDGGQVEGTPEQVLGLVDALTVEVMRSVLDATGRTSSAQTFRLASLLTESVPALRHYLEGDAAFRRTRFPEARQALERAIEEDSTFALAYWRLGETIGWTDGIGDQDGLDAKRRARELGDRLPEREATLLDVGFAIADGHAEDEVDNLRGYLRRYPDDPDGWYLMAESGMHRYGPTGVGDQEIEEALYKAVELDPTFGPYYEHAIEWATAKHDTEKYQSLIDGQDEAGVDGERRERALLRWKALWGSEAERAEAAAAIAELDERELIRIEQGMLGFMDRDLERLPILWEGRPDRAVRISTLYAQQGRIQELLALVDSTGDPNVQFGGIIQLLDWYDLGALTRGDLEPVYGRLADAPDAGMQNVFPIALVAGALGDASRHRAAVESVKALMQQQFTAAPDPEADTVGVREAVNALVTLDFVADSGDPEGAHRRFSQALAAAPDGFNFLAEWQGRSAIEAGLWREGIRQIEGRTRNQAFRTTGMFRLGKAFEGLGERDHALEAYRTFLSRTEGADPGLPPVEEARAAVARLGG